MTKSISTLLLASTLTFGSGAAHAQESARRGQVWVDGPTVKAVAAGPLSMHAYSLFAGGALYAVPAVSGTDADCQAGASEDTATPLRADVVITFDVPAGQIACLTTTRRLEVLWHARKAEPILAGADASGKKVASR